MKVYDAASIRNIALVGHGGSGKTQLTSCLLFNSGMVTRLGKVDEGNTVTDFDEEEIARKHTLSASIAFAGMESMIARAYTNGLMDDPGCRSACVARLNDERAKSRPPTMACTSPVSGSSATTSPWRYSLCSRGTADIFGWL